MNDVKVTVKGLDEVRRRLEELNDGKLARSIMRSGARKAAQVLKAAQQDECPVDRGNLRDSIGIQVTGAKGDTLIVKIGPDKRWNYIGRFHEFGTKFMAGIHWMQKAFDRSSKEALDAFITEVKRRLDVRTYRELRRMIEDGLNISDGEIAAE
jgi:HK97 gp10 family phage protein